MMFGRRRTASAAKPLSRPEPESGRNLPSVAAARRLFGFLRPFWLPMTGLCLVLASGTNLIFPWVIHLFADHGYTGPLKEWIKDLLGWEIEILTKESNESHQKWVLVDGKPVLQKLSKGGFHVQCHRWKVERTFGWLIRYRRLARDYEGLPSSSEALIQIAAIRLCFTRLTPFCSVVT